MSDLNSARHVDVLARADTLPLWQVVNLLGNDRYSDYFVYEDPAGLTVATGVRGSIDVYSDRVEMRWNGVVDSRPLLGGDPFAALQDALDSLPHPWKAYGWMAFETSYHRYAPAEFDRVVRHLAHLQIPEAEAHWSGDGWTASGELAATLASSASAAPDNLERRTLPSVDLGDDRCDYTGRVRRAVAEIRNGLYPKVILSRTVSVPAELDLPATWALGRTANTPARSFLLRSSTAASPFEMAGFSPELVAAVHEDGRVITEPVAGTRALGISAASDDRAVHELRTDSKELAEHAMSVRESVNELTQICRDGSVTVSDFMSIRRRGSVQHLGSTVDGLLVPGTRPMTALAALFPAITASGLPKSTCIEAISRLDACERGPYSGATLVATSEGDLESALVLRSCFSDGESTWLRAGAGIVAESTPEREFDETCEKLRSMSPYLVSRDHHPEATPILQGAPQ